MADDDAALRMLCRVNLELDGYRVLEAASKTELLQLLADEEIRAVLLDVHLGHDDGIEIAREMRGDHPDVRVAFFSGSVMGLQTRAGGVAGEFLSKPFSLEELSATVGRLVLPPPP